MGAPNRPGALRWDTRSDVLESGFPLKCNANSGEADLDDN